MTPGWYKWRSKTARDDGRVIYRYSRIHWLGADCRAIATFGPSDMTRVESPPENRRCKRCVWWLNQPVKTQWAPQFAGPRAELCCPEHGWYRTSTRICPHCTFSIGALVAVPAVRLTEGEHAEVIALASDAGVSVRAMLSHLLRVGLTRIE
jgi:hypothetical protein